MNPNQMIFIVCEACNGFQVRWPRDLEGAVCKWCRTPLRFPAKSLCPALHDVEELVIFEA